MTTKAQPAAPTKNVKSRILQTVSETAADLDRLGFIDKRKQYKIEAQHQRINHAQPGNPREEP